jgi:uncharacterized protein
MQWLESALASIQSWAIAIGPVLMGLLLMAACLVAWASNLVTLPGNWFMAILVAIYACLGVDPSSRPAIGLGSVVLVFALAFVGEVVEFVAGAAGAKKAGASRKSTILAIIGSMIGALVGAFVGVPIPIVGSIIAAILFAGLGATAGAMFGEWTDGRAWRDSWSIGHAAFWGRTFGTLGKVSVGVAILAWVAIALCFS